MIDNSGLRLFYTADLRRYDAGVIEAGLWVSLFHNIPPGMPEFMSEGHCTRECLEEVCFLTSVIGCDSVPFIENRQSKCFCLEEWYVLFQ